MADTRFDGYPVDARFSGYLFGPIPNDLGDGEHSSYPIDERFPTPGTDDRFGGAVAPSTPNEYLNPELAGGAASGPGAGGASNPPTNHGIGFNTVDSFPSGNSPFRWEINPSEESGRAFLDYDIAVNHPGLTVGTVLKFQYAVANFSAANYGAAIAVSGDSNVGIEYKGRTAVAQRVSEVRVDVTILDPSYAARIRVGVGTTSVRTEHLSVFNPRLEIISA